MLLYRFQSADMIQVFKIMQGIDNIPFEVFFQMTDSSNRGHTLKLFKPRLNKSELLIFENNRRMGVRKFTRTDRHGLNYRNGPVFQLVFVIII